MLRHDRHTGSTHVRSKCGALLKGLVRCEACGYGMSYHLATSKGKRYRYYVCVKARKRGWASCPSPSLQAGEPERFVVEQIRSLGRDDGVIVDTLRQTQRRL